MVRWEALARTTTARYALMQAIMAEEQMKEKHQSLEIGKV